MCPRKHIDTAMARAAHPYCIDWVIHLSRYGKMITSFLAE